MAGFCHPTKPKYPKPLASPRNPHPSPPHNTNLPTTPKTTTPHPNPPNPDPVTPTPSLIAHTVAPPPPQTTTMLSPETIPPVDFVVHMEVEDNPGIDFPLMEIPKRKEDLFESQLKAIDDAIQYQPKNPPPIKNPSILTKTLPNQIPRTIMGDITNYESPTVVGPKQQGGKQSWKKLARAQTRNEDAPLEPIYMKRTSTSLEDINPVAEVLKKWCGGINENISAEAGLQPRRDP